MALKKATYLFLFVLSLLTRVDLTAQSFYVSISTEDDTDICPGESIAATLVFYFGSSPYTVVINDNEGEYLVLEKIKSPHTFNITPESDNTYYIASAVDRRGRQGIPSGSIAVTVHPPTPVSIIMERTAYLVTEPGVPLVSDPPGGVFEGNGVSGNTFYPSVAGTSGSPHEISCTFQNQYDCVSEASQLVHVLSGVAGIYLVSGGDTVQTVCDFGAEYIIKGNNEDNLTGTFELFPAGSGIPVPGHIIDNDLTDNEAVLLVAGLAGNYELVYKYGIDGLEISAATGFMASDVGMIGIRDLPDTVCQSDDPYPLIPDVSAVDPDAVFTFSGRGVYGNQSEGFFFDPGDVNDVNELSGSVEITLDYTSSSGCRSLVSEKVYVGSIPVLSFTLNQVCIAPEGTIVSFYNQTLNKERIAEWSWDFGDPASGSNNTSNLENPVHFYSEPGFRTILLTAISHEGCQGQHQLDTLMIDQPVADFTWMDDCYLDEQGTSFLATPVSMYAALDTMIWTFRTADGNLLGEVGKEPAEFTVGFTFPAPGDYNVTLMVENEAGCRGEQTRRIELLSLYVLAGADYLETFDGLASGWSASSEEQLESWVLGEPDFEGFEPIQNDRAWYTDLPVHTGDYLEHSWIRSPCFDLSGLSHPVVQLDLMKSFFPGIDGAVLQYQDMVQSGWKTLGTIGGGLNWYNDSVIYNMPGGSGTGWGLRQFEPDTEWIPARHSLQMVAGNPRVKFRLAVATGGSREVSPGVFNQGFAFDNFFIGEGILRRSVLEYFTNAAGESIYPADSMVKSFGMEHTGIVFDLHYHMNEPEEDPMYLYNPYPPSARAVRYGILGAPYAVLNGGGTPEYRFDLSPPSTGLDDQLLIRSALEAPVFDLDLLVDYQQNRLEGSVTVTCLDGAFDSNLDLYIVVIEKDVTLYPGLSLDTSFRNVVLDMLPPTGILLGNNWSSGSTVIEEFSWDYADYLEDIEDLCVVAFVQDRDHEWVLQADVNHHTAYVGTPEIVDDYSALVLYPNPATDHLTVYFERRTEQEGRLEVVDVSGHEMITTTVEQGSVVHQLDISHLPEGMYMIFWKESGIIRGYGKLFRHR